MKNKFAIGLVLNFAAPLAPALLTIGVAQARPANVPVHAPAPGSKERAAILNALRIPVTKYHGGKKVTFYDVEPLMVGGGWAYLYCRPANDKGKSLSSGKIKNVAALLRIRNGKWSVVEWAYAEDVIKIKWSEKHTDVSYDVLGLESGDEGGG